MSIFNRKKKRGTNVPEQQSVPPMPTPERGCFNCKHTNKTYKDEPCCDCDPLTKIPDKWEPKEPTP